MGAGVLVEVLTIAGERGLSSLLEDCKALENALIWLCKYDMMKVMKITLGVLSRVPPGVMRLHQQGCESVGMRGGTVKPQRASPSAVESFAAG